VGKAPGAVNVEGDIDCDTPTVIWTTKQKKHPNSISEYLKKGMDSEGTCIERVGLSERKGDS
jgi:hypothetical protein